MTQTLYHEISNSPLFIIAGPCVIENEIILMEVAEVLTDIKKDFAIPVIFKSSFDKANRTSIKSFRGPGLKKGIKILQKIKEDFQLPILTDIHESWQASEVSEVADIIQIPAFLSRQTDLLVSASKTGRIINIKKGQFMSPEDMKYASEKVASTGNTNILLTERGTTFGYRDLVVDMRGIAIMNRFSYPVVIDATHSIQRPSAGEGRSSGNPEYIETIAISALAAGAKGLFLEVHPRPNEALSDSANSLELKRLKNLIDKALKLKIFMMELDHAGNSTGH